jgi:hypothetical protein
MSNNKKKIIHALTIVDKSGSMQGYRNRTIEGINANINALKAEVDGDTTILNTQLQFSSGNNIWSTPRDDDFVFPRVGKAVETLVDMTDADYRPDGGTPLLDAIGYGVEKVKDFHGDKLGDDNLKIIVTIFTDGAENSSKKWTKDDIKKMVEHFQSDGKWTFTFVGCGSLDAVTATSAQFGVSTANTVAYDTSEEGTRGAYSKIATSYSNFARSTKLGVVDHNLFTEK